MINHGSERDTVKNKPACRNWQTRQTQNLLLATTCGFKSRRRQYKKLIYKFTGYGEFIYKLFYDSYQNRGVRSFRKVLQYA